MPFFKVLIRGSNVSIPAEDEGPAIVGFYTSRIVWSNTRANAEQKALGSVKELWTTGRYASRPSAARLALSVSESGPASLSQWFFAPNKGHAFFAAEPAGDA